MFLSQQVTSAVNKVFKKCVSLFYPFVVVRSVFFIFLWTRFWPPARYNSLMVAQSAHPHGGLHVIESDKEEIPWNYEVGNPSHIVRTDEISVTFWDVWQEVLTALGLLG